MPVPSTRGAQGPCSTSPALRISKLLPGTTHTMHIYLGGLGLPQILHLHVLGRKRMGRFTPHTTACHVDAAACQDAQFRAALGYADEPEGRAAPRRGCPGLQPGVAHLSAHRPPLLAALWLQRPLLPAGMHGVQRASARACMAPQLPAWAHAHPAWARRAKFDFAAWAGRAIGAKAGS